MTQIPYGDPDTVYGVITERLPDGGVTITVPFPTGPLNWISNFFTRALNALPYRAQITLNHECLLIIEQGNTDSSNQPIEWRWLLAAVGEVRANRYYKGLYVSIPGTFNGDFLIDVSPKIVNYVGKTLTETLARLRSGPLAPEGRGSG